MSCKRAHILLAVVAIILGGVILYLGCGQRKKVARLTILFTGNIESYIENCGCMSGQYGGLKRMARLTREELANASEPHPQDRGRPAVGILVDTGNFTDPSTDVSRVRSGGVVNAMATMGYDAVGLGRFELAFSQADLWQLLGGAGLPLVAANLSFFAPSEGEDRSAELNGLVEPYRIVELTSGFCMGIIHVVDENVQDVVGKLNGYELTDAAEAAGRILGSHGKEADYWLLTIANTEANGTSPGSIADLEGLGLVNGYRRANPRQAEGAIEAVFPFFVPPPYLKAKNVVEVVVHFKPEGADPVILSKSLAVPDTIKADDQVQAIIDQIAPDLERLENERAEREMQLRELVHPTYVGYESCRPCHAEIVKRHLGTRHPGALNSLVEKRQNRSAACLPCHVVGHSNLPSVKWSGGWNIIEDQEEMRGVHCESCHGPGEYHVQLMSALEQDTDPPAFLNEVLAAEGRDTSGLLPAGRDTCIVCHDELNSPGFNFEEYWRKIAH